jgi:hypothetical protein
MQEAAARDRQMRMHEDRRLIQNMKFIKRLEDDG